MSFSDISKAAAMNDEAPEGSEVPRDALKAKIVPARTMWFFLSYGYTVLASRKLKRLEEFMLPWKSPQLAYNTAYSLIPTLPLKSQLLV
jgi:hypothetical protein